MKRLVSNIINSKNSLVIICIVLICALICISQRALVITNEFIEKDVYDKYYGLLNEVSIADFIKKGIRLQNITQFLYFFGLMFDFFFLYAILKTVLRYLFPDIENDKLLNAYAFAYLFILLGYMLKIVLYTFFVTSYSLKSYMYDFPLSIGPSNGVVNVFVLCYIASFALLVKHVSPTKAWRTSIIVNVSYYFVVFWFSYFSR